VHLRRQGCGSDLSCVEDFACGTADIRTDREEEVIGLDRAVLESQCLTESCLQRSLGIRSERDVAAGHGLAGTEQLLDRVAQHPVGQRERVERTRHCVVVAVASERDKQVLAPDVPGA